MVGDCRVGKSFLIRRILSEFDAGDWHTDEEELTTFDTREVTVEGQKMELWDVL